MLGLLGCAEPPSAPSPDIPATVAAAIKTALPAPTLTPPATPTPTPEPSYWPTQEDFIIVVSPVVASYNSLGKEAYYSLFPEYEITYIAKECVRGRRMSAEGFRTFVADIGLGRAIYSEVRVVLEFIVALATYSPQSGGSGGIEAALDRPCMRMYLQPQMLPYKPGGELEMHLSVGLFVALAKGRLHPMFLTTAVAAIEERAGGWFTMDPNTRPDYIVWLCEMNKCMGEG